MIYLILFCLSSFVVPLPQKYLEYKLDIFNPLNHKVYLSGIPIYKELDPLRFWNFGEFNSDSKNITFFNDSLLAPEVLLYSIRREVGSEVGGYVKTPISKAQNQLFITYTNFRELSISSNLLVGFKHDGRFRSTLAFGRYLGNNRFAFNLKYKDLTASFGMGDLKEAKLNYKIGPFSMEYSLENNIHRVLTGYKFLKAGLGYYKNGVTPYVELNPRWNNLNLSLEYGTGAFRDRVENRLKGVLEYNMEILKLGFTGKIGKEGVYIVEDTLIGVPYSAGFYGILESKIAKLGIGYFYPKNYRSTFCLEKEFSFKGGEVLIRPFAIIGYSKNKGFDGEVSIPLILFKSVEMRGTYHSRDGLSFAIGVNLFD